MKKIVLLFQLLIIIFSTTMAFMLFNIDFFFLSVIVMFLVFSVYFIYLLLRFDTQITYEEASCDPLLSAKEVDVCVVVVVKNEGEQIINTAKHYLSFPENVRMLVYDDDSTDDSILNLSELSEEYNNRLEIKKLVKRDLFVHPKAFGTEDAFNSVRNAMFLVIDADTIIDHSDFLKAVSAMENEKIDVLHIARRNDKRNTFVDNLADKEELMNMAFHLTQINNHQFGGSGYFVRSDFVRGLKYVDGISSEDTYVLKYVKERGAKIRFFFTLMAHERAPKDYPSLIKQRINWLNQSIPFYLQNHFFLTTFAHFLFSISAVGFVFPISIGYVFTAIIFAILMAIEMAFVFKILKQNIWKAIYYTFLLALNIALVVWPIYIFLLVKELVPHSTKQIYKNQ